MADPPPSTGGTLAGLLDRAFRYMDTPWKALVVVVLVILAGVGWFLYDKRDELFEVWLTPDAPELMTAEVPAALDRLATETNADLVQIWSVDLLTNSQRFLGARRHDGEKPVIPSPRRLPVLDHTSDVRNLVAVLDGKPTCVDLLVNGTPVARRLAERGMKRGCAIPIPPGPESFVGVVYLAWTTQTDVSNENVAVAAAREIASKLATH
jgi:hypothetical protein